MDPSPAEDIPYSYSNPDLVAVTHTHLELSVNFKRHVLEGKAILTVKKKVLTCNELILDTYGLDISEVSIYSTGEILYPFFGNHHNNSGRKLTITLPNVGSADPGPSSSKEMEVSDNKYIIQINYKTVPIYNALYWLEHHQTSDGGPLLISNSKLTHARAIFPCQDTPSNRITFESKITVPSGCGLDVMMPGNAKSMREANDIVEYTFLQLLQNIAPHEIYIVVGKLRNREVSTGNLRYNLWTVERYLNEGIWAIHKIMPMLSKIKESYHFNYIVNVCVLPPNVPEFDMQYPDVTFVSSTLLEGHYFMISTIVQNIIESWIGRTVVIDDFKHLWLIKGLSTFIYRNPINNIIDAEDIREFLKIKGINNVLNMPELRTVSLVPVFTQNLLPINIIKYVSEKGCVFLNYLQDKIGGPEKFKSFLVNGLWPHCKERKILTTNRFEILLKRYFSTNGKPEILNTVDWDKWFNEPDFPPSYYNSMVIRSRWQREVTKDRRYVSA
ncbi:leukotriene A-4 hydrolase-like isoform X2 [Temnothorax curvispinosus]|uniref:Leukotriene A-4 hydrolase-like isoform X2 n=1 Tax=Temnothorax curvispinosus TaxID=300111 RepID=A0A6J1QJA5_9HYME|nr:leukotriene A-4 hydrolase-like isoform X2 [Temnothorax curvispinosus]